MSVYTVVDRPELEAFLAHYSHDSLIDFQGISAGIENTNYFVTTEKGEYVLTLFEQHSADELGYFLELMAFLAEHGVPSAHPVADVQGDYLRTLKGKPAALVQRLPGKSVEQPTAAHCRRRSYMLPRRANARYDGRPVTVADSSVASASPSTSSAIINSGRPD